MSWKRIKLFVEAANGERNRKSWFLFDSEKCRIVSDLSYLIAKRFGLNQAHVALELDQYHLPPSEKIDIVRDNDSITVTALPLTNTSAAHIGTRPFNVDCSSRSIAANKCKDDTSNTSLAESSSGESSSSSSSSNSSTPVNSFFLSTMMQNSTPNMPSPPPRPSPSSVLKSSSQFNAGSLHSCQSKNAKGDTPAFKKPLIRPKGSAAKTVKSASGKKMQLYSKSMPSVTATRQSASGSSNKTAPATAGSMAKMSQSKTGSGTHIRFTESDDSVDDMETQSVSTEDQTAKEVESGHFISFNQNSSVQPKIGDRMKYKVLELSSDYTPNLSAYKEGTITSINLSTQAVTLKLSRETVGQEVARLKAHCIGKFSLSEETEDENVDECVDIKLSEMIEPMIFEKDA